MKNNVVNFSDYYKPNKGATYAVFNQGTNTVQYHDFITNDALIAFLYDAGILGYEMDSDDYVK